MSAVELVALAASVSLLAGWRLYLVVFATGLAMKFGWVALPDQLRALDVLASNWIIGVAGLGAFAEFFADKIAWVDSACRPPKVERLPRAKEPARSTVEPRKEVRDRIPGLCPGDERPQDVNEENRAKAPSVGRM